MCRKLFLLVTVVLVLALAVPANAEDYWLAGDWNGWQTGDPNGTQMTEGPAGEWSATVTGLVADSRQEFKLYESWYDTWAPGSNSWLFADGEGEVTVGYNTNVVSDGWLTDQYRIGLSTDPGTWTIAGSFGGAGLPDWDNAGAGMGMAAQGGGIYMLSLALPMGSGPDWIGDPDLNTFAWKAVVTGSWDSICEDTRSINTANAEFTITLGYQIVDFYVDSYTGVVKTEVVEGVPEPATIALLGLGGLALLRRKRGYGA